MKIVSCEVCGGKMSKLPKHMQERYGGNICKKCRESDLGFRPVDIDDKELELDVPTKVKGDFGEGMAEKVFREQFPNQMSYVKMSELQKWVNNHQRGQRKYGLPAKGSPSNKPYIKMHYKYDSFPHNIEEEFIARELSFMLSTDNEPVFDYCINFNRKTVSKITSDTFRFVEVKMRNSRLSKHQKEMIEKSRVPVFVLRINVDIPDTVDAKFEEV